jgi:hypothetical protein
LRDPWWQAAGAILAALALGLTLLGIPDGGAQGNDETSAPSPASGNPNVKSPPGESAPSPPNSPSPSTTVPPAGDTVNCSNGDGNGNTNNCNILPPPPIGDVSYKMRHSSWAWFDGPASKLPPPRKGETRLSICAQWNNWLTDTKKLHVVDPLFDVNLIGNRSDRVQITDIQAEVYRRTRLDAGNGTLVKCEFMGGDVSYYFATVNTATGRTTFQKSEDGQPSGDHRVYEMPPSIIALKEGGYTSAQVALKSLDGWLYEGSIAFTASINGKESTFKIGTVDRPFRWATPQTRDEALDQEAPFVAWNGEAARWVKDYSPLEDQLS